MRYILIAIIFHTFINCLSQKQEIFLLSGNVKEEKSGLPLELVTVVIKENLLWATTDSSGFFSIKNINPGKYTVSLSCLGYKTIEKSIIINANNIGNVFLMQELTLGLDEVTVVAKENKLSSTSQIGQSAIKHIQPRSIQDILQLLPGHITENPSLKNPGQINIRGVGSMSEGQLYFDKSNNTSALGAAIIIDDIPVSTNSDMQLFSTAKSGLTGKLPSVAGRGVDLRTFSPDNVELIEVIRGIPSAEYGDLTSGAVIIHTKKGKTPTNIKLRIDPNTKMYFFSKGFELNKQYGVINAGADYTEYYSDNRFEFRGYKRITTNLAYNNTLFRNSIPMEFSLNTSFFNTIDNEKSDSQLLSDERIRSEKFGFRFGIKGKLFVNNTLISNIIYSLSGSYTHQDDFQRKVQVLSGGTAPLPISYEEGENEAEYLPSEYYSELTLDGKPYNIFANIRINKSFRINKLLNNITLGAEWRTNGNNGKGQIYDINYPPYEISESTIRPRSFKSVPPLNLLSFFVQNKFSIPIYDKLLTANLGLRYFNIQPQNIFQSNIYNSIEPRLNISFNILSDNSKMFRNLSVRGGLGISAKAPTLLYLYPNKVYFDAPSFNYYDPEGSLAVLTTKIISDVSNPDLKAAINKKSELGIDFNFWGAKGFITVYHEKQTNGFSFETKPYFLKHRKYIVEGGGKKPFFKKDEGVFYFDNNNIIKAPFVNDTSIYFYKVPTNNHVLIKKGVEYSVNLGKLKYLYTNFYIDGAYAYTKSYSAIDKYSRINKIYNGNPFLYVPLYPGGEIRIRQRFNTSLRTVTHIPIIKMIFSIKTQFIWFNKDKRKYENNNGDIYVYVKENNKIIDVDKPYTYIGENVTKHVNPIAFMDKKQKIHPWTNNIDASKQPYYSMVKSYDDKFFLDELYPLAVQFDIKITKEFAKNMTLAFTANNFLNIRPNVSLARSSGYEKLNTPMYFGAELKVKFK